MTSLATAARVRETQLLRVLRLDALVGIAVTGIVHWLLLRPILDLHGQDYVADKLLQWRCRWSPSSAGCSSVLAAR